MNEEGEAAPVEATFPMRAEAQARLSSDLRKAQVRAALFRKLEPIKIGRFILLERLGAGAMGELYTAYDDQLDRKVAIKLVRSGADHGPNADERLLREAQTLAQVSHPNVVQIYEAGTYNGRLFIAMELIRGKTLTSWLGELKQAPRAQRQREILRQFIAAGRGLEAAHAAGVAHRDFKPDNVLVGDDGRVRVVDFGLARALVDELDELERGKDRGGAAPAPRRAAVDRGRKQIAVLDRTEPPSGAASPIPLVTGAATIDHEPRQVEAPAHRAATGDAVTGDAVTGDVATGDADSGAPIAAPRRAGSGEPAASAPRLKAAARLTETGAVMGTPYFMAPEQMRGEIADRRSDQFSFCVALYHALYDAFPFWGQSLQELKSSMETGEIELVPNVPVAGFVRKALLRGLSVEPSQRFASMSELLAALEPKARHGRSWLAVAVCLMVLLLGGFSYLRSRVTADPCAAAGTGIDAPWSAKLQVALQAAFHRSELPFAEPAWRGVKALLDGYATSWRDEATAACRATHITRTQSAQQLDRRMQCLDRGRRQLAALVTELGTGTPEVVEHAIEATEALPDLGACSHAENLLFGLAPPPAPVAAKVAALRDRLARALTLELLGHPEESLGIAREVSAAAEGLGYPPVHAEALAQIARALDVRGTAAARAEAEGLYFEALDIAEAQRHDQLAVKIWGKLVMLAVRMDSGTAQAHAWWRRNAAAARRIGDNDYEQAKLHHMLGEIYYRESQYARAAEQERLAIAVIARVPAHQLELSRYYDALAKSLELMDQLDEALRLHERALAIATETLGASHLNVIELQINHANALRKRGQFDRARAVLEDALGNLAVGYRDSHPDAAKIHSLLSDLDYRAGRLDSAAEHGRASLQIYQRNQSPDHVSLTEAYTNLANVEIRRRSFTSALALYEDVLALRRRHLGDDHYQTGVTEGSIAETLLELSRYDQAMTHLVEAERIFARGSGRQQVVKAWMLTVRGEILAGKRQFSAAIPVLEQALQLFGDAATDPTNHALARWTLARALHQLGRDSGRVRSLAERAHELFAAQGAMDAHNRDAVARFLEQLPARR